MGLPLAEVFPHTVGLPHTAITVNIHIPHLVFYRTLGLPSVRALDEHMTKTFTGLSSKPSQKAQHSTAFTWNLATSALLKIAATGARNRVADQSEWATSKHKQELDCG